MPLPINGQLESGKTGLNPAAFDNTFVVPYESFVRWDKGVFGSVKGTKVLKGYQNPNIIGRQILLGVQVYENRFEIFDAIRSDQPYESSNFIGYPMINGIPSDLFQPPLN
ncbi:MAG TPA: hypothetical protein VLA72_20465 [Anaerolineales bacterium]|nr:hypothetical protein [Anaerolineales bacterium]